MTAKETTVANKDRLDEIDALTERLEKVEHDAKVALLAGVGAWLGLLLATKAIERIAAQPTSSPWTDRRISDLERALHVHMHPKEYTHHDT